MNHPQSMTAELERAIPNPIGWLIHPRKKLVLFFIDEPNSPTHGTKVITQLWHSTAEGIPTHIKNTRTIQMENAIETWNELLNNGWQLVEHQINDTAA